MIEGRSERAGPGLLSIATLTGFPAVKLGVSPRPRKIRRPQDEKQSILTLALSVATLGIPVLADGTPQETNQDDRKAGANEYQGHGESGR